MPAGRTYSICSRLGRLGEGYTERRRWSEARRRFGSVLERAESCCGSDGVKYCLVHFFLDLVHHGPVITWAPMKERSRPAHLHMTPLADARLEMLLAVQEFFPIYLDIAEELASELKEREEQVQGLLEGGPTTRPLPDTIVSGCNLRSSSRSPRAPRPPTPRVGLP